ncbi:MAG: deoxynucleoside kinase [Candidatus Thiodiazotropha sp.]
MSKYIVVTGSIASGKSTLIKKLSEISGYSILPEPDVALSMLCNLFSEPARWAAEVQLAFLIQKAANIKKLHTTGADFIVDRSLEEDAQIFEKHFYESNYISDGMHQVYSDAFEILTSCLPKPNCYIYCECTYNVACKRIKGRNKQYDKYFEDKHLQTIYKRYGIWKNAFKKEMIELNSLHDDWRSMAVAKSLYEEKIKYKL